MIDTQILATYSHASILNLQETSFISKGLSLVDLTSEPLEKAQFNDASHAGVHLAKADIFGHWHKCWEQITPTEDNEPKFSLIMTCFADACSVSRFPAFIRLHLQQCCYN